MRFWLKKDDGGCGGECERWNPTGIVRGLFVGDGRPTDEWQRKSFNEEIQSFIDLILAIKETKYVLSGSELDGHPMAKRSRGVAIYYLEKAPGPRP